MATMQIKDGFEGGSDNQLKVNSDGSINVNATGGGGGSNASVGINGDAAPSSSTQIGGVDHEGNLAPIKIDDEGRVEVNAGQIFGVQDLKILYSEESAVVVGLETTLGSYTAPIGKTAYLLSILASGGNRAQFNVYNNSVMFDRQYTNVAQLSAPFDYKTGSSSVPGMVISTGDTIEVAVVNSGTDVADYNVRLMILEVTN